MTKTELIQMKLHESFTVDAVSILRVLGGWIYTFNNQVGLSSCFVPEEINIVNKPIADFE